MSMDEFMDTDKELHEDGGITPAHEAAQMGKLDVIKVLVKHLGAKRVAETTNSRGHSVKAVAQKRVAEFLSQRK
jgi:hypothetical protein